MPLKSQVTLGLSMITQQTCDQTENWICEIQFQIKINNSIIIGYVQSDTYTIHAAQNKVQ